MDWVRTTVGEVMTLQRGFDITRKEQRAGGVPVVSSGGVSSYHDRFMAEGPGVVIGRKGSLGTVFYITSRYWPHDTTLWVKDFKGNAPRFVYYFLKQLDVRGLDVGSANPSLNRNHVHSIPIYWPKYVSEQHAIAAVLGPLDDKIAANSRLIGTADELAMNLVKSRVVVGIKTELQHVASVTMGSSPPSASFNDSRTGLAFYQGVRDFGVRTPTERIWTVNPVRFACEHDILISVRAPVGRVNRAASRCSIGRGLAAVQSTESRPSTLFHLVQLADWAPFEAEGTVFGSISRQQLLEISLPVLKDSAQLEIEVAGLEALIAGHLAENRTLAELRDTLLPALMSGRLRVKDAERQVEDAV